MAGTTQRTTLPPLLEIDDVTRREFLIGAVGLLLLPAGCGSGEGSGSGGETTSGETRTIRHALGESEVPVDPQRVIVLDPCVALPTLLDLGVPVIGAGSQYATGEPFTEPYLRPEEVRDIEAVGEADQPNFESVAALEPDLIIGWSVFVEPFYERLAEIAPTVATEASVLRGDLWKSDLCTIAEMFGKRERIDEQIADYEARVEALRPRLDERLGGAEVSVARITSGNIELYYRCAWPGPLLEEAGLRRPENQRVDDCSQGEYIELGEELIAKIDADILFYFVRGSGGDVEAGRATAERFYRSPLWRRLEAVQNDRAFAVDADIWGPAPNIRTANLVLDDLEKYLIDGGGP